MDPAQAAYLMVTTHDFKTHFSHYLKLLKAGRYEGIMVFRNRTYVGYFKPTRVRLALDRRYMTKNMPET